MPKLDPDDQATSTTPAASPAPSSTPSFFSGSSASAPSTSGFGTGTSGPTYSGGSFGGSSGFNGSQGGFGGGMNGGFNNANAQQSAATANAFGNVMAAEAASGAPPEHWMQKFWRPAMGWLYMLICFADFVAFPLISMFLPLIERGFGVQVGYTAWQSLTLSNGGLIHLAFGAILGVSAYGRTQENIKKAT